MAHERPARVHIDTHEILEQQRLEDLPQTDERPTESTESRAQRVDLSLPSHAITAEQAQAHGDEACPICLEKLLEGQTARTVPCGHMFHADCIEPWTETTRLCPICRRGMNNPMLSV